MSNNPTPRQQLNSLLDSQFNTVAQLINQSYSREITRGVLNTRLTQLITEAQRLDALGQRLTPDNPVLRALLADLEQVLRQQIAAAGGLAGQLEDGAINAASELTVDLSLGGMNKAALAKLGFSFNVPDPDVIANVVNTTNTQEFRDFIANFGSQESDRIRQIILAGIAAGKGPLTIARDLTRTIEGLPRSDMNTFLRTLQLTSYRKAQDVLAMANTDILEKKIRIASLDARCCLACVFLHGQELRLDESVIDHHNGRCTAILVVKGRPMNVRRGEDWFNALPKDSQRSLAGEANFNALQAGKVTLGDFVGKSTDAIFGDMLREQSLKGILGAGAKEFYPATRNAPAPITTRKPQPLASITIGTQEIQGSPIPPR